MMQKTDIVLLIFIDPVHFTYQYAPLFYLDVENIFVVNVKSSFLSNTVIKLWF